MTLVILGMYMLGLFGVKQSSQEFLRVYVVSLSIVIVTEVVVWFILFANIHLFQHYTLQSAIAAGLAIAAEVYYLFLHSFLFSVVCVANVMVLMCVHNYRY
jgi:hypothetical protein